MHFDIMDGSFVPNLTFGTKVVRDLRPLCSSVFDVHLMVEHPERYVEGFAEAGADFITFHSEACIHAHRLVAEIRKLGKKPGISIVPATPISVLEELLPYIDLVLVMTVDPGFGGQTMITSCLKKIAGLKQARSDGGYHFLISADGGLNKETAKAAWNAGVDVLVTGSAFFNAPDKSAFIKALLR